ncbi:hypothetical protein CC2G_014828 [Coprinopsis cinerea AmutBmut pab1-1]|nr:hypothetical protein CC2G_014828 [Coprinopsis cinerea AmutBmut pab1-1]
MGYVSWIGDVAKKNAVLVDILESLGAIPFVKTNVPQTLMWAETFNYVFGRTVNPYNRELTAGGSSGGEGALIAMQGSPLGVGSDIGGSIRIPSGYCGIYGLRPSFHRIPYGNCRNSLEGQESVPSVLGPMAPGISMIKLFMKTVLSKRPWMMDPLVIRKAWSEDEYKLNDHGGGKRLCFGILWDDGVIIPNPPVTRGLEEVKAALVSARHQVVDWKPIKHKEIFNAIANIFAAGCAEDFEMTCAIEDEPLVSSMTIEEELKVETGEVSRPEVKGVSAFQLWQVQKKRRDLRQEYLDWWQSSQEWAQTDTGRPIDAIICPVAPHVAPLHGKTVSDHYTMVWNALDYPGLVIPVSRVDPVRDIKVERSELLGDDDRANYEGYDPEAFRDAPISIQLIGRTLEEEALIGMAEIVDAALKKARE